MAVVAAPPRSLRHPQHGETATFLQASHESDGLRTILHLVLGPAGGECVPRSAAYAKSFDLRTAEEAHYPRSGQATGTQP